MSGYYDVTNECSIQRLASLACNSKAMVLYLMSLIVPVLRHIIALFAEFGFAKRTSLSAEEYWAGPAVSRTLTRNYF